MTADEAGTLFVDGVEPQRIEPDQVATLKLIAGQHFVDLRNAKGEKLWDKIVTVPAGSQSVEKIKVHLATPSGSVQV